MRDCSEAVHPNSNNDVTLLAFLESYYCFSTLPSIIENFQWPKGCVPKAFSSSSNNLFQFRVLSGGATFLFWKSSSASRDSLVNLKLRENFFNARLFFAALDLLLSDENANALVIDHAYHVVGGSLPGPHSLT